MTDCCSSADHHFDAARAARELTDYQHRGPRGTARIILALLRDVGAQPVTLLDIGAGIGVLHHELLAQGVRTAVHVEGVSAYVAAARAETDRRGQQERVRFLQGDAVVLGASLAPADLVTLDRVVCCYPDLDPLVRVTTALAHRYYAISFPHDRWYMRRYTAWQNRERRRAENPFRTFVHQGDRIGSLIRAAGLRPMRTRQTFAWAVQLYARLDAA